MTQYHGTKTFIWRCIYAFLRRLSKATHVKTPEGVPNPVPGESSASTPDQTQLNQQINIFRNTWYTEKFAGAGLVLNSAGLGSSVWATGILTRLCVSSSCVQFFSVWGGRGTVLCQQYRGGEGKHTDDWTHTHHLDVGVLHACVCVFAVFCGAISGLGGDIRGGNGSWQE